MNRITNAKACKPTEKEQRFCGTQLQPPTTHTPVVSKHERPGLYAEFACFAVFHHTGSETGGRRRLGYRTVNVDVIVNIFECWSA